MATDGLGPEVLTPGQEVAERVAGVVGEEWKKMITNNRIIDSFGLARMVARAVKAIGQGSSAVVPEDVFRATVVNLGHCPVEGTEIETMVPPYSKEEAKRLILGPI